MGKKNTEKRNDFIRRLRLRYGKRQADFFLFCVSVWKAIDSDNVATLLDVVDSLVLTGSDQDLKEFRDSRASICITAGVAGAVFTQVAITALSLPSIQSAHWAARGLWVAAIFYGVFAVKTSIEQQAQLSSCLDPRLIRDKLSFQKEAEATGEICTGGSIDAALGLASPQRFVNFSATTFFIGLTVYLGTVWTSGGNNVPGPNDSRNVFLCCICCLAGEFLKAVIVGAIKTLDIAMERGTGEDSTLVVQKRDGQAENSA